MIALIILEFTRTGKDKEGHLSATPQPRRNLINFKMAHHSGRDPQLLYDFSHRRIEPNRRDVGFSRIKAKRLGLVDDFRTFRIEKPDLGFVEYVVA